MAGEDTKLPCQIKQLLSPSPVGPPWSDNLQLGPGVLGVLGRQMILRIPSSAALPCKCRSAASLNLEPWHSYWCTATRC